MIGILLIIITVLLKRMSFSTHLSGGPGTGLVSRVAGAGAGAGGGAGAGAGACGAARMEKIVFMLLLSFSWLSLNDWTCD